MPTELKSDPASGVAVAGGSIYYSLDSTHWTNKSQPYTYHYGKPRDGWDDGEMATMNLANWGGQGKWYSAERRLGVALGFGQYEQSIKVGKGSGVTTAFYLSEYDTVQRQEIDFEFSGSSPQEVQTNVWRPDQQSPKQYNVVSPLGTGAGCTEGWGFSVYRYKIDWEPQTVTFSVDRKGSGKSYEKIREQTMSAVGSYDESLCYPFISFWTGWTFDNSPFLKGDDPEAKATCGESGKCYQAFFFQSLRFTPSASNRLVTLVG